MNIKRAQTTDELKEIRRLFREYEAFLDFGIALETSARLTRLQQRCGAVPSSPVYPWLHARALKS
ncbi:MAG: hypothetical protein U5R30_06015 [Deltaproteobacteria bacterium]|nr:hypothetical protein [Deltaproteobacteria bacterium]